MPAACLTIPESIRVPFQAGQPGLNPAGLLGTHLRFSAVKAVVASQFSSGSRVENRS